MVNKKNAVKDIGSNDSYLLQLLYSVLIIISLMIVIFVFRNVNVRETTNIKYDYATSSFVINDDALKRPAYMSDNWIFVPNFSRNEIRYDTRIDNIMKTHPYADHVEITNHGWNNLGSKTKWNRTDGNIVFDELELYNIPTVTGAYMTKIKYSSGQSKIYLDLGDINGHAYVYCNNKYVGEAGDLLEYEIIPNYNGGHNSSAIQVDSGTLEIIIVCYSNSKITSPGLVTIPTILSATYNTVFSTLPTAWISVIFTITVIAIIAGYHLGSTFKDNRVYYFFVLTILHIFLYNIVDNYFLILDSTTKQAARLLFFIGAAAFSYCFVSVLFKSKKYKNIGSADCIVVSCIGIAFVALDFLDSSLISTPFNEFCAIAYVSLLAVASIIKVLFFHLDSKNALFGSFASITVFFIYFAMLSQENLLCNISLYSVLYFIALIGILISFIRRYTLQYRELVNSSTHLKLAIEQKTAHISEINKDLINTNKKLLSNEEARKNVMSNVSHDLRTPITAIRGYAELLIKGSSTLSDEQKNNYLNNILKRSIQMERIVSDIVEISKMEATNFEFNFMDLSVNELLDEIYMLYSSDLSATKELTLDLPEEDFLMVKADPKRLSRVFENLISNAINYTKEEAHIAIKAWRSDADKPLSEQRIHITVSDDGIGIPPDEIERVFDRFYRAKNSGQNIKGTGLGLSIVKMIIDKHDAEITVTSEIGVGTTFHIVMKPTY